MSCPVCNEDLGRLRAENQQLRARLASHAAKADADLARSMNAAIDVVRAERDQLAARVRELERPGGVSTGA